MSLSRPAVPPRPPQASPPAARAQLCSAVTPVALQVALCCGTLCLLAICAAPAPARAQGDERILSYISEIEIRPDSTLEVSETIRVRAAGVDIKRGIYRDFPTTYNDTMFKRYHVGFILDAVLHNGAPSPYHVEPIANGLRIYIGDSEVWIPAGEHEYTLRYRTIKQLGFYPGGDELYWNVTGTDWMFPIDYAEARIRLPKPVDSRELKLNAYTGAFGATGSDYWSSMAGRQEVKFNTTKPLGPYSGLTVVVGFPKGVVLPPDPGLLRAFWREQHPGRVFGMYGVLAVFVFLFLAWALAGIDPKRGAVRPQAEPPEGLSPASLRYIRRMGCDFTCFTAAVTSLATRGHLAIAVDADGDYTLTQQKTDFSDTAAEETALALKLFAASSTIEIDQDNHARISAAKQALAQALSARYRRVYFFLNRPLSVIGLLLSAGVLAGMFIAAPVPGLIVFPAFVALALLSAINTVFWFLLPRYTRRGRRLLDQIEGFQLALRYGTEQALGIEGPDAEQLHEQYLASAIALDAHQEWADRLERRIRRTGERPHYFGWYNDPYDHHDRYNYHDFSHNLARSFTSSVSSASVAPGSSSGGSGGSSGGGGGGGGGGGW